MATADLDTADLDTADLARGARFGASGGAVVSAVAFLGRAARLGAGLVWVAAVSGVEAALGARGRRGLGASAGLAVSAGLEGVFAKETHSSLGRRTTPERKNLILSRGRVDFVTVSSSTDSPS